MRAHLALIAAMASACSLSVGDSPRVDPGWAAVHNAMVSMGTARSGSISTGTVPASEDEEPLRVPLATDRCYMFFAAASGGLERVQLSLETAQGEEFRGTSRGPYASLHVCPLEDRVATVRIEGSGHGRYSVTYWETVRPVRDPPQGTCSDPYDVELGETMRGFTHHAQSLMTGTCLDDSAAAPERVYRIRLQGPSLVRARLSADFDCALYLRRTCSDPATEQACSDDAPNQGQSYIAELLEAGTHYFVVDAWRDQTGTFELSVDAEPAGVHESLCSAAPLLDPNGAVHGETADAPSAFEPTCDSTGSSPEQLYRLVLDQPSRVRFRYGTHGYTGAISVRRECLSSGTEELCRQADADAPPERPTATGRLDAGSYTVIADGHGRNQHGSFDLAVETVPADGAPAATVGPIDTCATAPPIAAGRHVTDTFLARDDDAGSCGGRGGPDIFHRIEVAERSRVHVSLVPLEYRNPVLYLRRACGEGGEIACRAGSTLEAVVEPGAYLLGIDASDESGLGTAQLALRVDPAAQSEDVCNTAPMLAPGTIEGTTAGQGNRFTARCARADGPDVVYRLRLTRRSQVRLLLTASYDAVLHVRRQCMAPSEAENVEVACNDDFGDTDHSLVEEVLDPGTYFVVVDGYGTFTAGRYSLTTVVQDAPAP